MQPIRIYQNVYLIETNDNALNAVMNENALYGMLMVNYEKGQAEFDCRDYRLNFECFGINVEEKQGQIILITGERNYIFSSNEPDFERYL